LRLRILLQGWPGQDRQQYKTHWYRVPEYLHIKASVSKSFILDFNAFSEINSMSFRSFCKVFHDEGDEYRNAFFPVSVRAFGTESIKKS